mmetsp:Transcript_32535/g.81988  ORF Transcript_32535/g.81988 Transcript_32535/m.81988 type:complete len:309 (+) Transcript_32535:177-1103(+)
MKTHRPQNIQANCWRLTQPLVRGRCVPHSRPPPPCAYLCQGHRGRVRRAVRSFEARLRENAALCLTRWGGWGGMLAEGTHPVSAIWRRRRGWSATPEAEGEQQATPRGPSERGSRTREQRAFGGNGDKRTCHHGGSASDKTSPFQLVPLQERQRTACDEECVFGVRHLLPEERVQPDGKPCVLRVHREPRRLLRERVSGGRLRLLQGPPAGQAGAGHRQVGRALLHGVGLFGARLEALHLNLGGGALPSLLHPPLGSRGRRALARARSLRPRPCCQGRPAAWGSPGRTFGTPSAGAPPPPLCHISPSF